MVTTTVFHRSASADGLVFWSFPRTCWPRSFHWLRQAVVALSGCVGLRVVAAAAGQEQHECHAEGSATERGHEDACPSR